ncbi:MAG: hypothetical protein V4857_22005 [Pseudomonadota bacterium]
MSNYREPPAHVSARPSLFSDEVAARLDANDDPLLDNPAFFGPPARAPRKLRAALWVAGLCALALAIGAARWIAGQTRTDDSLDVIASSMSARVSGFSSPEPVQPGPGAAAIIDHGAAPARPGAEAEEPLPPLVLLKPEDHPGGRVAATAPVKPDARPDGQPDRKNDGKPDAKAPPALAAAPAAPAAMLRRALAASNAPAREETKPLALAAGKAVPATNDGKQAKAAGEAKKMLAAGEGKKMAVPGEAKNVAPVGEGKDVRVAGAIENMVAGSEVKKVKLAGEGKKLAPAVEAGGEGRRLATAGEGSRLVAAGDRKKLAAAGDGKKLAAAGVVKKARVGVPAEPKLAGLRADKGKRLSKAVEGPPKLAKAAVAPPKLVKVSGTPSKSARAAKPAMGAKEKRGKDVLLAAIAHQKRDGRAPVAGKQRQAKPCKVMRGDKANKCDGARSQPESKPPAPPVRASARRYTLGASAGRAG